MLLNAETGESNGALFMSKVLFLNFKFLSFLLMALVFGSCTKKKKADVQVDSSAEATLGLTALEKIAPFDGTFLSIKNLAAKNLQAQTLNLLEISFEEDPAADYYSFVICNIQNVCSPSSTSPGQVLHSPFVYPYAPVGTLNIQVKACLRTYNAKSEDKTCGPTLTTVFQQKQNPEGSLFSLVKKIYDLEQEILKKSVDLRQSFLKFTTSTQELVKTDSSLKDLRTVAQNALNIGQDPISQVLSSDFLLNVYNTLQQDGTGDSTETGLGLNLSDVPTAHPIINGSVVLSGAVVAISSQELAARYVLQQAEQNATEQLIIQQILSKIAIGVAFNNLSEDERKFLLNTELKKVGTYNTLQKVLVPGSELHKAVTENPDLVIERAAVHLDILEAAQVGAKGEPLTGAALLRQVKRNQLQKLEAKENPTVTEQNRINQLREDLKKSGPPLVEPVVSDPNNKPLNVDEQRANSIDRTRKIAEARVRVEADYNNAIHPTKRNVVKEFGKGLATGALVMTLSQMLRTAVGLVSSTTNSQTSTQTLKDELNAIYQAIITNRTQLAQLQQDLALALQKAKTSTP